MGCIANKKNEIFHSEVFMLLGHKSYDHSHGHWRRDVYLHDGQMLSEKVNVIKNLSEITLKVDIAIIADNSLDAAIHEKDGSDDINEEVVRWLTDIVELPQYLQIFRQEAIENMSIVKLLNMEILTKMKIKKIGHQLKILHQIDLLKETETK